ncbi:hypothetical protein [Nonomuraea sp. NPDC001831]|uniref:hypothetical protein n=1 Tax=Nonomuraea sp. NPDC001831 TaxID=3364340 RepID=UPI0036BCEB32
MDVDPLLISTIVGAVLSGLGSGALEKVQSRLRRPGSAEESPAPSAPGIEERADELADLLKRSTALLAELSAEMEARTATVRELQAEARHAESIASMHKDAQAAVEKMLDARLAARLEESGRKSFKQGMWLNIVSGAFFFIAGVVVTLLLGG